MKEVVPESSGNHNNEVEGAVVECSPSMPCQTVNDCIGREVVMADSDSTIGPQVITILPIENDLCAMTRIWGGDLNPGMNFAKATSRE